jgi:lipopolysaccharide transport system ATP-binding protein
MSDITIRAEGLSKQFRIGKVERYRTLRDTLGDALSAPFRNLRNSVRKREADTIWALNDVSFEIKHGEVVGIIGRNGAGKSTLLKVLSRITEPTKGYAEIHGRVGSLLEVGTGFHPELTGRENIFLNGAILGMKKAEILRKFDEIVAFAEVEKFIDTPVKHYSSGMHVRLAFAVAAHLEPEIMLVDEVLAVGDAGFQKKCVGKMGSAAASGRTILFVSHNVTAVRTLCSRAIVLIDGRMVGDGNVDEMLQTYIRTDGDAIASNWQRPTHTLGIAQTFFKTIEARLSGRQPTLRLTVTADVVCTRRPRRKLFVSVDLCDSFGTPLMQALPIPEPFMELREGDYRVQIQIQLPPMIPGRYIADVWLGSHHATTVDYVQRAVAVEIEDSPALGRTFPHSPNHGYLVPESCCEYERTNAYPRAGVCT